MAETDYGKYLVTEPLWEAGPGVSNRQSPTMTFMSGTQVPGVDCYIEFGWIWGMPEPNPHVHEHVHRFDEIVVHIGGDPNDPEDLGAEVEYYLGGQPLTFTTTSAIFVPKGVRHGPHTWKRYRKPHISMAIMIGAGTAREAWGERSGIRKPKTELPKKTDDADYERYLVRKPVHGHGSSNLTVMSKDLVGEADHHIDLGWVRSMTDAGIHGLEAVHDRDEIFFHIGGDMNSPLNLGAEVKFIIGGQTMVTAGTCGLWIPKGTKHGPFTRENLRKPFIQMSYRVGDVRDKIELPERD
jgi:hypothetical protein